MSNLDSTKNKQSIIRDLFENMNLSPAVDINNLAVSKILNYADIPGFVDGKFMLKEEIKSDADNECDSLISSALKSSTKGFEIWSSLNASSRSKILLRIAQTIEKYQPLFTALEAISSGKHIHKVKTKDIPNLIESFYYYAGCVLQLEDEFMSKAWFSIGPVGVITEEYNNPSLNLSLRVSSLLAAGNSILLLPEKKTSASAFFLAEICTESGVPDGVLNVIPVEQDKIKTIEKLPILSKLLFTGSYEKAISFSNLSSKAQVFCEVLIPKRPAVIIYENADLHSAANSVLESFFFHDTRSKSGGCKVFVQESVCKKFMEILERRFGNILVGENLSKTDLSCAVTEEQKKILTEYIEDAKHKGQVISFSATDKRLNYTHIPPVIINGLQTSYKLVHEELGGPIIVTIPFRTVKESISMFNCDNKGSPVSIWTEKMSVAIEVALKLKSGTVWVNSENVIDARTPFSGVYGSGISSEGGKDAFFSHLSVLPETLTICKDEDAYEMKKLEAWVSECKVHAPDIQGVKEDKVEYKLYINGIQKQSENGILTINGSTLIQAGTESDVQSTISSAVAAQPKWEAMTEPQKRKIILTIADKLRIKKEEYVTELQKVSGNSLDTCEKEFADTLDFLHYWASQNEKYNGSMQEIKKNFIVLQNRNPLGVIGIQCPNEKPLLSFISLIIPAVVFGNTVVALTSPKYPTLALKMCEIFTLSSVPGGVINVISGNISRLIPALCKHMDVNAIWYTDVPSKVIFDHCCFPQRIFLCQGIWNNFNGAKSLKFTLESTFNKTIFLPAGEIFAN